MRSRRSVRHCKGTCLRLRDPLFVRVCGAPRVARVSVPAPVDQAAFILAFVRRSPVRMLCSTGFAQVATRVMGVRPQPLLSSRYGLGRRLVRLASSGLARLGLARWLGLGVGLSRHPCDRRE